MARRTYVAALAHEIHRGIRPDIRPAGDALATPQEASFLDMQASLFQGGLEVEDRQDANVRRVVPRVRQVSRAWGPSEQQE